MKMESNTLWAAQHLIGLLILRSRLFLIPNIVICQRWHRSLGVIS